MLNIKKKMKFSIKYYQNILLCSNYFQTDYVNLFHNYIFYIFISWHFICQSFSTIWIALCDDISLLN